MMTLAQAPKVDWRLYAAVFFLSLDVLLYEILLTRIFSATTFYHFAFLSISTAMFGLALGAIFVFVNEGLFNAARSRLRMAQSACLFAVLAVCGVLLHVASPLMFGFGDPTTTICTALAVAFVPILGAFTAAGTAICLALTRFPSKLGKIYASDLSGAAAGCLLAVILINSFDAITDVLIASAIAGLAALIILPSGEHKRLRMLICSGIAAFVLLSGWQVLSLPSGTQPLRLNWSKGRRDESVIYDKWNALSHLRVSGNPLEKTRIDDATMSRTQSGLNVAQLRLDMDGLASSNMVKFQGDPSSVAFMQDDLTALAHHIRHHGSVLVIGMGAGRDVLSAISAGQSQVTAIEMNPDIVRIVNQRFGDFTGHLDRYRGVRVISDEARSALTRLNQKFDIIQASLIDTFAASSSGAYSLSENSIYTAQSFDIFLRHLTDNGVLTVSRWFAPQSPAEFYKLTALASCALSNLGVDDVRSHIMVIRNIPLAGFGVGTILVGRSPFGEQDVDSIEKVCARDGFQLLLSPKSCLDPMLQRLADPKQRAAAIAEYSSNISPPTDDRPFFFQMSKFDLLRPQNILAGSLDAVPVLVLLVFALFAVDFVRIPMLIKYKKQKQSLPSGSPKFLAYFFMIGIGFMLIELAQIQRLIIFLGHPVYGLTVVLFALLLGGGIGSYLSDFVRNLSRAKAAGCYIAICAVLTVFGISSGVVASHYVSAETPVRIADAILMMIPLGIALGMPFPLGMRSAENYGNMRPWFWGINGVASVFGSLLSTVIAIAVGLGCAYWLGVLCYLVAGVLLASALAKPSSLLTAEA